MIKSPTHLGYRNQNRSKSMSVCLPNSTNVVAQSEDESIQLTALLSSQDPRMCYHIDLTLLGSTQEPLISSS
nr:hypothetical protein HmN_000167500 [Hymenolepis microstoma]